MTDSTSALTFTVGHDELTIRRRHGTLSIVNDILIAVWFTVVRMLATAGCRWPEVFENMTASDTADLALREAGDRVVPVVREASDAPSSVAPTAVARSLPVVCWPLLGHTLPLAVVGSGA